MLFHFQLTPVADIGPWTTPSRGNEKHLHWFGLTNGCYWLDVGGTELLRYSQPLLDHWAREYPKARPSLYVNYYVVRLWEDILGMLPAVLEPVPEDLAAYIRPGGAWESWAAWEQWSDRAYIWMDAVEDDSWEFFGNATAWWGERRLDTGYLSVGSSIWFWRDGDSIHIRWDNTTLQLKGLPVWAEALGESELSATEFVAEVRSFDARLIQAMAERVDAVCHDWPHPNVRLDWNDLRKEHRRRSTFCEECLVQPPLQTNWNEVRQALAEVEHRNGGVTP